MTIWSKIIRAAVYVDTEKYRVACLPSSCRKPTVRPVVSDNRAEKVDKKSPLPANNFLHQEYKDKPFRTYTVVFRADISRMKLIHTPDGVGHGTVECVAVVYDQSGDTVQGAQTP
jgi:hypothetical protein